MPYPIEPMLAVSARRLPEDAEKYALEVKWDGIRAICHIDEGVRVNGRRGTDITARYPELGALPTGRRMILDGEVVAFDERGLPSFGRLQHRMHVTDPGRLTRLIPVTYIIFDLLYLDDRLLFDLPYQERRALLDTLGLDVPGNFPCEPGVLDATRRQGLEGVVAKRLDAPYRPGRREAFWIKVKNFLATEVVVGGWRPGRGRRGGGIGSLLLGMYGEHGGRGERGLIFVGHVGTGFSDAMLDDLLARLEPLEIGASPFVNELPPEITRDARWARPELVGEVTYTMWTGDRRLRHPVWQGLRPDKTPDEVVF